MKLVAKRSVFLAGRSTSVSLEDEFWEALQEIADSRDETVSQLATRINAERKTANLSSNLRVFVLDHYRDQFSRGSLVDLTPAEAPALNSL